MGFSWNNSILIWTGKKIIKVAEEQDRENNTGETLKIPKPQKGFIVSIK